MFTTLPEISLVMKIRASSSMEAREIEGKLDEQGVTYSRSGHEYNNNLHVVASLLDVQECADGCAFELNGLECGDLFLNISQKGPLVVCTEYGEPCRPFRISSRKYYNEAWFSLPHCITVSYDQTTKNLRILQHRIQSTKDSEETLVKVESELKWEGKFTDLPAEYARFARAARFARYNAEAVVEILFFIKSEDYNLAEADATIARGAMLCEAEAA